jgi:argonaute-like protein implicated in RNA metabolism and viral defense
VLSESEIAQSLLETVAVTQRKLRFENAITERTVIELVNARASNRNKLIRLIDMLQDAKRVEEVEHIRWALSNLAK